MVMEEEQSRMELEAEKIPVPQVQKPVNIPTMEPNNEIINISKRKPRFRKKALHAAILKQMEFYFSDANLSKDRFLGTLIKQNPYVDLSIFTRFNKIRELTTDINRIAKALQASTMLSISEDGTKVCRITPIKEKDNIDDCTVYVQNLTPDMTHDSLTSIFSQYGTVVYVSIPRYKNNKKIKGFAFVEFNTPEEAHKCLNDFKEKGCLLPSHTVPDELLSITTFDDDEKNILRKDMKGRNENIEIDDTFMSTCTDIEADMEAENDIETKNETNINESCSTDEQLEFKQAKKRKHDSASAENDTCSSGIAVQSTEPEIKNHKKVKTKHLDKSTDIPSDDSKFVNETLTEETSLEESQMTELNGDKTEYTDESPKKPKKKIKRIKSTDENKTDKIAESFSEEENTIKVTTVETNMEGTASNEKKKKRKRKRKNKVEDSIYNTGLQVMHKKDWKHLRNKYLQLQRSKMNQLKQHLKKTRNQWSNYDKIKLEKEECNEKKQTSNAKDSIRSFTFTPGVIVKIELNEPCVDTKSLKMEWKSNSNVKYIDVSHNSSEAYVRCDTPEAARLFAQGSTEDRAMKILEGEEEQKYWNKILQDREEKLSKKVRVKQRGRSKLLKKAEKELGKHIKFDEV